MSAVYLVPILVTDDTGKSEIVFAAPSGKWYKPDGTETEAKFTRPPPQDVSLPLELIRQANQVVNNA